MTTTTQVRKLYTPYHMVLTSIQENFARSHAELLKKEKLSYDDEFLLKRHIEAYLSENHYNCEDYSLTELAGRIFNDMVGFSFLSDYLSEEKISQMGIEEININNWLPQYHRNRHQAIRLELSAAKELEMYLGFNFRPINCELRDDYHLQFMSTDEANRARRRKAAELLADLIREQCIPENIILYRAIRDIRHVKQMLVESPYSLHKNSLLTDRGFMSTGLVYQTLRKEMDSKIFLRFLCPKGTQGAYVNLISRRPNEQEVLLPPNTTFRLIKRYRNMDNKLILDCTIVND